MPSQHISKLLKAVTRDGLCLFNVFCYSVPLFDQLLSMSMSRTVGVSRDLSHRLVYRSLTVSAFLFNRPTTREGLCRLGYVTLSAPFFSTLVSVPPLHSNASNGYRSHDYNTRCKCSRGHLEHAEVSLCIQPTTRWNTCSELLAANVAATPSQCSYVVSRVDWTQRHFPLTTLSNTESKTKFLLRPPPLHLHILRSSLQPH